MRLAALLFGLALWLAAAPAARAQDAAVLLADRVFVSGDTVLVAEGNVEVLWRGARLRAQRISYDRAADRLTIDGPITLTDGGEVAIFAEAAELSADLQDGLLTSARMVLAEQLQLAAVEIARVGGRYTELSKVVASSCQVCPSNPVPLWSIRARRVIHDQETRQIYFEGAQFRVGRVPVAYIPRLRFPDPTLKRATGILFPTFRSTSALGTGIKLPYFITLGRSADVTLTPYLGRGTTTLELRYRQAFRTGDIIFEGAVSDDVILPGETRYYVFGDGAFELPRGFRLDFGLQTVSDDAYLLDYGYSDADRLTNSIGISRTRRDESISAELRHLHSLREGEDNATLPTLVSEAEFERRFVPGGIGGIATLTFGALTSYRYSDLDAAGRDVARANARIGWEGTGVFGPGLLVTGAARLTGQVYGINDDAAFGGSVSRLLPEAAVTLRWPLARTGAGGAVQVLEPVAMLAWAPEDPALAPNEDSTLAEFDEANLYGFSRYPGGDGLERGVRLALGLGWTRHDPAGWSMGLTFGRLFREADRGDFGEGTGLDGVRSDWLAAVSLDLPNRLDLTARALVDDDLSVSRAELRMRYGAPRGNVETGFAYLSAAPGEGRTAEIAEWTLDGDWKLSPVWTGRANWRYDLEAGRPATAGLGLGYENECVRVDLSLSRRFTSSTSVRPTTNFGLSVALTGFGTGGESGAPRRRCMN